MEDKFLTINEFSDKQWNEILKLALDIYRSKPHEDYSKCVIHAFVEWLTVQDFSIAIECDDKLH